MTSAAIGITALPARPAAALSRRGGQAPARAVARAGLPGKALRSGISIRQPARKMPVRMAAAGGPPPADDDDNIAFEPKRKNRGPKVVAPQVEQALGKTQTAASEKETLALQALGFFFFVIMMEGLVLAFSGFLPEAVDEFATNVLYDSFSPQVGFFLVCSTGYGLWKSQQV